MQTRTRIITTLFGIALSLGVTQHPATAESGIAAIEDMCHSYALMLENTAKARDDGITLLTIKRGTRQSLEAMSPTARQASEAGLLWVYQSSWLSPPRIRQQAEMRCLTQWRTMLGMPETSTRRY
jgi:hypothetical protein